MCGVTANTVAQMVEIAQNVEIDINLEKAARTSEDTKGKGKLYAGTPSWKRRKAGSGVSVGTQTTLSGEEPPRKVTKDVKSYNCHERGHFRDRCPLLRQPRQEYSVQTVQPVPQDVCSRSIVRPYQHLQLSQSSFSPISL